MPEKLAPSLENGAYVIVDLRSSGELAMFWRSNRSGYTTNLDKAGCYLRAEALEIVRGSHEICALPLDRLQVEAVRVVSFTSARDLKCMGRIDPEGSAA